MVRGDKGAQRAVLRYRVLNVEDRAPSRLKTGQSPSLQLLEVNLETGRYHQIRAQLAAIGCPIAGDTKYGAKQKSKAGDIALHHRQLEVVHPIRKEPVIIEAPYPDDSGWW